MFLSRSYSRQEDVPEGLQLLGFSIGDTVLYCGHEGTITMFREPDSLVSATAEAEINWGKQRSE